MRQRLIRCSVVVLLAAAMTACATSRAFMRGERAARAGDWDAAVEYYRQAMEDDPDRAEYKIAYERAAFAAAAMHADRARKAEEDGRLEEALREYRRASELDPSNRQVALKAAQLEQLIRERLEAARPRPEIERLREEAQKISPEPILSPTTPLGPVNFNNASVRDILTFIGQATGINVLFDRDFVDRTTSINVEGVTLEQALQQIMLTNQLFYKVLDPKTIIVIPDTTAKRNQYEEQVVRTFFLSHADAAEMQQLLTSIIRIPGMAVQPQFMFNKTTNTLTARASTGVMQIIERILQANDKPRAEVIIDVQILEVSRERAKQYGLNLNNYQLGGIFSPETKPDEDAAGSTFNLNTVSQGVSTADFYLSVPAAIVRFLESDSRTKVLAKPQLRGAEGQKVSLNLGEEVPIPSTTFLPIASGGATTNPLTSFVYRSIGINVEMTPRVTYEGEIILDLTLENSARGTDVVIAGQSLPAFSSRKVSTRLRLRDGESNLLAGLLREDERRALTGFPGLLRMPVLQQLFGASDSTIRQTDIVMLLTPRIVRTHELTAQDLSPIFIGPQSNLSLGGGPPPLLGQPPEGQPGAAAPAEPGTPAPTAPAGSPVPGTVVPPAAPTTPALPAPTPAEPVSPVPPREPAPVPAPAAPQSPATPVEPPGGGRIQVAAPPAMTVGGGPYTVPISIAGASRLSTLSLTITYDPALLRVSGVQEGTFMRQGGVPATFTSQPDPGGRVDIVATRTDDTTGAVGSGIVAAVLFEPIAPGTAQIGVTGVGTVAGTGAQTALQFVPASVVIK